METKTEKYVVGYRFHISCGKRRESSPYPGYKTREECEQAALRCKHFLEERGGYNICLRFEDVIAIRSKESAQ